ncbi:hypothetical protein CABS01_14810 [Colletotrichum abscissum]|uniref:uncharacterized protein n=1 Tax=Colletotrichum abscissum TaxID=1671311 RepID=UPI0027D6D96D|nr:uncharacterized protein CABS01_14810 [Colletotrichum abscissum]KAK1478624.1 hypothetical protein CABS01_14810 [Colletotrichum abscissum]
MSSFLIVSAAKNQVAMNPITLWSSMPSVSLAASYRTSGSIMTGPIKSYSTPAFHSLFTSWIPFLPTYLKIPRNGLQVWHSIRAPK